MNITEAELRARFPSASKSTLARNGLSDERNKSIDQDSRSAAKLERDFGNDPLETAPIQKRIGQRVLVRFTSFRHRLLDEDNLCPKFLCDLCRYAGIIPGDDPATTKIEVCQIKVGKGEPEFVQIEIS